jgi:hypothetical protein
VLPHVNLIQGRVTVSTSQKPRLDAAIQIKQLLKDREDKIRNYHCKDYQDAPKAIADGRPEVGDNNAEWPVVLVAMESGRVWKSVNRGPWQSASWAPLPNTPAAEEFDEIQSMNRELRALGHVDED